MLGVERFSRLHLLNGDVTNEEFVKSGFSNAEERFGPANILIVNSAAEDLTAKADRVHTHSMGVEGLVGPVAPAYSAL